LSPQKKMKLYINNKWIASYKKSKIITYSLKPRNAPFTRDKWSILASSSDKEKSRWTP
jgi:hypothetical protein